MSPPALRRSTVLLALLVTGAALAAAACTSVSRLSQARAEISGPEDTSVQIVTSRRFVVTGQTGPTLNPDSAGRRVNLQTADTVQRTLPTTVTRSVTQTQRIYIQVSAGDTVSLPDSAPAEIRLFIDGDEKARNPGDLADAPLGVIYRASIIG